VVLFDLGGVVLESPVEGILQYEADMGLPRHAINLLLSKSALFHQLERGELALQQFAPLFDREVARAAERKESADFAAAMRQVSAADLFQRMTVVQARTPMLNAIAALRARGIVVCAVTNNWRSRTQDTRGDQMAEQFDSVFDLVVESCVEHVRKPDPAIFQIALSRAQQLITQRAGGAQQPQPLQPAEVAFLDDLGKNLSAARKLGIHTIKVDKQFGRALQQLAEAAGVPLEALVSAPRAKL